MNPTVSLELTPCDAQGEQYVIGQDRIPYLLPCGDLCATTCLDQALLQPTYSVRRALPPDVRGGYQNTHRHPKNFIASLYPGTFSLPSRPIRLLYQTLGCFTDVVGDRALGLQQAPSCGEGQDGMSPGVRMPEFSGFRQKAVCLLVHSVALLRVLPMHLHHFLHRAKMSHMLDRTQRSR